ncbi:MAG: hypothetical protein ACTHLU_02590 [Novosphingobium sp.]
MSNAPSTFRAESGQDVHFDWDDGAELHRRNDGGLLSGFKAVRRGELAELIRFVMHLPEAERRDYAIAKAGDHRLEWPEITALAARPDFPPHGSSGA